MIQVNPLLVGAFLSSLLVTAGELLVTHWLGETVTAALAEGGRGMLLRLFILAAGIVLLSGCYWLSNYGFGLYANRSMYRIRRQTMDSLQKMPLSSYDRYTTGDLMRRMNADMGRIDVFLRSVVQDTLLKLTVGFAAAAYGFFLNAYVTAAIFGTALLAGIIRYRYSHGLTQLQDAYQRSAGKAGQILQEAIDGRLEIRSYGLKNWMLERYGRHIQTGIRNKYKAAHADSILDTTGVTAGIAIQIGTVFLCLVFVLADRMTIGQLMVFQQIQEMIRHLFDLSFTEFSKFKASDRRVRELWQEENEPGGGSELELPSAGGGPLVSLNNVSYTTRRLNDAAGAEQEVLRNISFTIHRGQMVALVGASGSGKTTLIKLLCGLAVPSSGEILFGGLSMNEWKPAVLRRHIGWVGQQAELFPVSIYDNIACARYGLRPNQSSQEKLKPLVRKAAERAALPPFLQTLERGADTVVGERGSTLSGGQRQRVSIARAFAKEADLLLLDEPTSALDAELESIIINSLERARESSGVLIAAHRLSAIKGADLILVLDRGEIVERGTHAELIAKRGHYYQLFQRQIFNDKELPL